MRELVIYSFFCLILLAMFIFGYRVKRNEKDFKETVGTFCGIVLALILIGTICFFY